MTFTVIDWIFGILILIFSLTGLIKGFVDCVFNKLCWILGIICACLFYDLPAKTFLSTFQNEVLANILGFIIIFVAVFLVVKMIQAVISKIFQLDMLKSLDKVLGFGFGIIEGVAIVSVIIFILNKQPFFNSEPLLEGSFFYSLVDKIFLATKEIGTHV